MEGYLLAVSFTAERDHFSLVLRALLSSWGLHPHDPLTSQRLLSSNTSPLRVRVLTVLLGNRNIQFITESFLGVIAKSKGVSSLNPCSSPSHSWFSCPRERGRQRVTCTTHGFPGWTLVPSGLHFSDKFSTKQAQLMWLGGPGGGRWIVSQWGRICDLIKTRMLKNLNLSMLHLSLQSIVPWGFLAHYC